MTQAVIVSRLKDILQVLVRVNIYNFIFSVSNIFRMFSKTTNDMWAIMCYCVVYNSTREHKNSILRNRGSSLHPRALGFPLISCWSLFPLAAMIHSLDHNHQTHPLTVLTVAKTTGCILCAVVTYTHSMLIALVLHWLCSLGFRALPPEIICHTVLAALKSFLLRWSGNDVLEDYLYSQSMAVTTFSDYAASSVYS